MSKYARSTRNVGVLEEILCFYVTISNNIPTCFHKEYLMFLCKNQKTCWYFLSIVDFIPQITPHFYFSQFSYYTTTKYFKTLRLFLYFLFFFKEHFPPILYNEFNFFHNNFLHPSPLSLLFTKTFLLFWQEESTFSLFQPSNNNNNPFSISFISCTHISKLSEKHSFWHICQQISHFLSLLHLSKNSSTKPPITLFLYTNLTKQHIFARKHTLYNTNKSNLKILYFDLIIYIFCTFLLPFHYMQWISLKTINNHTFMYANQNHFRFLVHNQKYPQNR